MHKFLERGSQAFLRKPKQQLRNHPTNDIRSLRLCTCAAASRSTAIGARLFAMHAKVVEWMEHLQLKQ